MRRSEANPNPMPPLPPAMDLLLCHADLVAKARPLQLEQLAEAWKRNTKGFEVLMIYFRPFANESLSPVKQPVPYVLLSLELAQLREAFGRLFNVDAWRPRYLAEGADATRLGPELEQLAMALGWYPSFLEAAITSAYLSSSANKPPDSARERSRALSLFYQPLWPNRDVCLLRSILFFSGCPYHHLKLPAMDPQYAAEVADAAEVAAATPLQQAQLAEALWGDPSHFEALITDLMSPANEPRSQAESLFNLAKQADPNVLSLKLAYLLCECPRLELRDMSAILLRKLLTRDDSVYPRLTPTTQYFLKYVPLALIQLEEAKTITWNLCDTVSELASGILPDNGWPELLPLMFRWVSFDSPKLQEAAFRIFAQVIQYSRDSLTRYIEDLRGVFLTCLSSSNNADVKIAALIAVINFIRWLPTSSGRDRFRDLLPMTMDTLTEALDNGDEATAQEALELLIEIARTEPRFFSESQLVKVLSSMQQIAERESLEENTRHLAIQFVITLAEAREWARGMRTILQPCLRGLFAILMKMLLDIEDGPVWHSAETEDEDAGESSNYSVWQECLDRLSISLDGNTIILIASEKLPEYLDAGEWEKRRAALIAIARIAEGCSEEKKEDLKRFVPMVLPSFQDPHPRVRWAAINAVGQLSTILGPGPAGAIPSTGLALAGAMDDFAESSCTGNSA